MPAYNAPVPVLRQVLLEVNPLVRSNPEETAALIDELWKQSNLECCLLAISILGMLPVQEPASILSRVRAWSKTTEDKLVEALLDQGLANMRKDSLPLFLLLVEEWLQSSDWREQQLGLRALLPPVSEVSFDDLPALYRLITPTLRGAPAILRPELLALLAALAQRSPQETAFYLRENIVYPNTPWLIRQVLQEFPLSIQENLRAALQSPRRQF